MTDLEVSEQDYNIDFERIKVLISKYEEIKHNFSIGWGLFGILFCLQKLFYLPNP